MGPARRPLLAVALGCAALLAASPAAAEPFLDLFTGVSDTESADVRIEQPAVGNDFKIRNLAFDGEAFEDPPYYGVRVGYFFEGVPWLGLGLEFFHFKVFGDTRATREVTGTRGGVPIAAAVRVDSVVQNFDISHGVNYLMVDVLARYGFFKDPDDYPNGRLQVYAGAGVGPVITHAETEIENVKSEPGYELGGVGVQGFAGIRFLLFRYLGVFVEGKITHSSLTVGVARGGEASLDETTKHLVFGLTAVFP